MANDRLDIKPYEEPRSPGPLAVKARPLGPPDSNRLRPAEPPAGRANRDDGVYAVEWQMSPAWAR